MNIRWLDGSTTSTDENGMLTNDMPNARHTSLNDLVTAKQLGILRKIREDFNIDVADECEKLHGLKVSELSKTGAYTLIEHLERLKRPGSLAA